METNPRDEDQHRSALVLYGTETGTSQDIAEEVSRCLERLHFITATTDLDNVKYQDLADETLVVFVVATTGQGDFPSNCLKFWTSLLRKKLTSTTLTGVEYALVGLGDSSYPKFNWAARKLEKRLKQLGASALLESCEADEQGEDSTDGAFLAWLKEFREAVSQNYPLPEGVEPIAENIPLPSRYSLAVESRHNVQTGHVKGVDAQYIEDDAFEVVLERNERVTPQDHWQDVRLLSLCTASSLEAGSNGGSRPIMDYLPGDAIAIMPKNMSADVDTLVARMQWEDMVNEPVVVVDGRAQTRTRLPSLVDKLPQKNLTIRKLLTEIFDINAIPRRSFFSVLAKYTEDEMHRERLLEFADAQYLDEYYDYATRPRRSILEILQEFDSVCIPWQDLINVFPLLRPRQFSIASSSSVLNKDKSGTRFELLVAIVKYRTVIKRIREGVCTRYLAQLPKGSRFKVSLKTGGRLTTRAQLNQQQHLLIGAGTGIAPLRAIVGEKMFHHQQIPPTVVVFGARNEKADYFFQTEWEKLVDGEGNFQMITAFSRDQRTKCYVQDKIRENSARIAELLLAENSCVVICGSSGQMPKAVRQALLDSLSAGGSSGLENGSQQAMSLDEAEEYLKHLEKVGRFKQETWS